MAKRFCTSCGAAFEPRAQSPKQTYCSKASCQRARKSLWQQTRRKTDADYQKNQVDAQRNWCAKHPEYWRNYRETHPHYTEMNRLKQRKRNTANTPQPTLAKSDVSSPWPPPAGAYKLQELGRSKDAPVRFWLVTLTLVE